MPLPASAPYICGFISRHGLFAVPDDEAGKELVLVNGEAVWLDWPKENITKYIKTMEALWGKRMPRRLTATKRNRVIGRLGKTAFSFIPVNIKKVG